MNKTKYYEAAKEQYAALGIDTDAAIRQLAEIPISLHCWQGDDVRGFDQDGPLSGGIQTTGNYPGRARNPEELIADLDKAISLLPGKHKLNLHASYAVFGSEKPADRDKLKPEHFAAWVEYAKKRGLGLDFNPTCFSHPKAEEFTLSSPDEEIRSFWVRHCQACIRISEYFATETGQPCLMNLWIPDGLKDIPADRLSPRKRFSQSLDEILSIPYDKEKVFVSLESKVFGIGLESYTVGSSEFCLNYAASRGIVPLLDNGHYHPTEMVSDKISSMLLFHPKLALHITRPIRWDSDHVVRLDDETKEIAAEIVRNHAIDRVLIGLDYFDASINRIFAWVMGMRSVRKALLTALLSPSQQLLELQEKGAYTELMYLQEKLKTYPVGAVWDYFCEQNGVLTEDDWFAEIQTYERDVLSSRI